MNGLEREFGEYLDDLKRRKVIVAWRWRPFRIRCNTVQVEKGRQHTTWYTPDFYACNPDGTTTIYETKGYERPEGIRRLKDAAAAMPHWEFKLVKKCPALGGWGMELFKGIEE